MEIPSESIARKLSKLVSQDIADEQEGFLVNQEILDQMRKDAEEDRDLTFSEIVAEDPEVVDLLTKAGCANEKYVEMYNRKRKRINAIVRAIDGAEVEREHT